MIASEVGAEPEAIWVVAPLGRDAELACEMLTSAGMDCRPSRSLVDLFEQGLDRLTSLVLTEEVLSAAAVSALSVLLQAQPPWSSLPIVIFVDRHRGATSYEDRNLADVFGSGMGVVLLDRPVQAASFVSVMRSAVLTRRRQYELRDQLEARRKAEAYAQVLAEEMKHRVKNAFTIVLALAERTFRKAESIEDALKAFSARIQSMSRAQDVLTSSGQEAADLHELIDRVLAPYRSPRESDAFFVAGPQVRLGSRTATALAMALHELCTNAVKYGSLSVASGKVAIDWRLDDAASGPLLRLEWREHDGPPVAPPERRGFGSVLVERALASDLGGHAKLAFDPSGVVCTICAALGSSAG